MNQRGYFLAFVLALVDILQW
ncbi:hypothetical protein TNIN_210721, partial [Trichonephila inaurata madagascariensis]